MVELTGGARRLDLSRPLGIIFILGRETSGPRRGLPASHRREEQGHSAQKGHRRPCDQRDPDRKVEPRRDASAHSRSDEGEDRDAPHATEPVRRPKRSMPFDRGRPAMSPIEGADPTDPIRLGAPEGVEPCEIAGAVFHSTLTAVPEAETISMPPSLPTTS